MQAEPGEIISNPPFLSFNSCFLIEKVSQGAQGMRNGRKESMAFIAFIAVHGVLCDTKLQVSQGSQRLRNELKVISYLQLS